MKNDVIKVLDLLIKKKFPEYLCVSGKFVVNKF